jgi:hypothetical protein
MREQHHALGMPFASAEQRVEGATDRAAGAFEALGDVFGDLVRRHLERAGLPVEGTAASPKRSRIMPRCEPAKM